MSSDKTAPPNVADIRAAVAGRTKQIQAEAPGVSRQAKRFLSLAEMLAEPVAPDWLINGFLTADTLAMVYGESTAMKSFVALDMGLCIATGTPWHGAKVSRPGPVAYVAAEGGVGMRKRIRAWATEHKLTTPAPFFTLPEPAALPDGPDMDALLAGLEEIVAQHGPLRLIVLDTLARTFGGLDENSSRDMGVYVAALDRLRLTFKCAVMVIHHTGLAAPQRARGSSVLRAALDWEMSLEVKDEVRTLTVTKAKDYEAPAPRGFKPKSVGIGWPDPATGNELTSCVLELTEATVAFGKGPKLKPKERIALETLESLAKDAKGGRIHIDVWREEAKRRGISTSTEKRARNKACKEAIESLLETGLVETFDDFYWLAGTAGTSGNSSRPFQGGEPGTLPFRGVPVVPTQGGGTGVPSRSEEEEDA